MDVETLACLHVSFATRLKIVVKMTYMYRNIRVATTLFPRKKTK